MRRVLAVVRFALLAGLVLVGLLALFLPGNRTEADGPADPILDLRRPVLEALRETGVVPRPWFLQGDPWLPSGFSSFTSSNDAPFRAEPDEMVEERPVYRGLFWRIGTRVRCTVNDDRYVRLRLTVAGPEGTRTVEEGAPAAPGARTMTVEAFAPIGWRAWRLDGIDRDGAAHWLRITSTPGADDLDPDAERG